MTVVDLDRWAARWQPRPVETWEDTPGALAMHVTRAWSLESRQRQAPHLELIDRAFVRISEGTLKRLIIMMPPRHGKLIAHDEPVPTPDGWIRHGDLQVGDRVYGPDGAPTCVTELHPDGEATLRVRTSDGGGVIVHPAHEWTVYNRSAHRWETRETRDIASRQLMLGDGRYVFQLPRRGVLRGHRRPLPVDPYTLGLWLGDGTTRAGTITHAAADQPTTLPYELARRHVHATTGVVTSAYRGLWTDLRRAGVAGDKHIPDDYLWADEGRRLELLAGLIDSDGHINGTNRVVFVNTNRRLIDAVAMLVRSFGWRVSISEKEPGTSTGGVQARKLCWRVTFSPDLPIPVRLERKRLNASGKSLRRRLAIAAVEPVDPRPGRCISVCREDGLYLVGENMIPTHNSERASRWGPLWYLRRHPSRRVVLASYGAELAEEHSQWVRDMIEANSGEDDSEDLGLRVSPTKRANNRWQLTTDGRHAPGGMTAVGIGGALTGRGADLEIIDDPVKNREDANSPTFRRKTWDWWTSTARTRLQPGGAVIVIQTRWHEDDLAGRMLFTNDGEWEVINLPALAEDDDLLGREPGEPLWPEQYDINALAAIRKDVGTRDWIALYQQRPAPPEGAVWRWIWIKRVPEQDAYARIIVAVDPAATSGAGAADTGIVVVARGYDGHGYVLADRSVHGTPGEWGRAACQAALMFHADAIVVEKNQGGEMTSSTLTNAWQDVSKQLMPRIIPVSARVSKRLRAEPVAAQYEAGRIFHAGTFPELEDQMTGWTGEGDSPDRLDALVHGLTEVMAGAFGPARSHPVAQERLDRPGELVVDERVRKGRRPANVRL